MSHYQDDSIVSLQSLHHLIPEKSIKLRHTEKSEEMF